MSPSITIRDVSDITHKRLVVLAKKHHRSLRGQLVYLLEQAVRDVNTFETAFPEDEKESDR